MDERNQTGCDLSEVRILFIDIDNTLLDFDAYVRQTMETGFREFGLRAYEPWMYDVFCRINNHLWHQIEMGELSFEELQKVRWNKIFAELGIDYDGPTFEVYFRRSLNASAVVVDGAREMIEYLSDKFVLFAASNGPKDQQVNRLKIAGFLPFFADVYASEELGASKPASEFFDEAIGRLTKTLNRPVSRSEILMLGDSLTSDMDGGIGAGLHTCWYTRGRSPEDKGDRKIDALITDLRDIRKIL